MFCLSGIGVGQASVSAKDYNETASQLLKSAVRSDDLNQVKQGDLMKYYPVQLSVPSYLTAINSVATQVNFMWADLNRETILIDGVTPDLNYYGATIDGNIIVKYHNGGTRVVSPSINFTQTQPIECSCGGVASRNECNLSSSVLSQNCSITSPNADSNLLRGIIKFNIPAGVVDEIDFNVLADQVPAALEFSASIELDYNQLEETVVTTGEQQTSSFGQGGFRIYPPFENTVFLLRSFSQLSQTVNQPGTAISFNSLKTTCPNIKAGTAWVGDPTTPGKSIGNDSNYIYWTTPQFMNEVDANAYCKDSNFIGYNPELVPTDINVDKNSYTVWWVQQHTKIVYPSVNVGLSDVNWVQKDGTHGFWTANCTKQFNPNPSLFGWWSSPQFQPMYQNVCRVLFRGTDGNFYPSGSQAFFDSLSNLDSQPAPYYDPYIWAEQKFAPLCRAKISTIPNLPKTSAEWNNACNSLGLVCDSNAHACSMPPSIEADSFVSPYFTGEISPLVDFNVTSVNTNLGPLSNGAVKVWIEGGYLEAVFLGTDYAAYNDGSIEQSIDATNVTSSQYGTVVATDYVNKDHLRNNK